MRYTPFVRLQGLLFQKPVLPRAAWVMGSLKLMFGLEWFLACTLPPPPLLSIPSPSRFSSFLPPSLLLWKEAQRFLLASDMCSQSLPWILRGTWLRCPEWTHAQNIAFISFIPFSGSLPTPLTGIPGISFWINYLLPNPCPRACLWRNWSFILQTLTQKAVTASTLPDLLFPY